MSYPTLRLDVPVTGVDDAIARLGVDATERRINRGMRESLVYLQGEVKRGTPVNTGALRGSVFSEMRGRTIDGLHGVVASPLNYAPVVEYGRKPGTMPPVEAIEMWARRVLGIEGLGLIIARKIKWRGTKGHHMFANAAKKGGLVVAGIIRRHLAAP